MSNFQSLLGALLLTVTSNLTLAAPPQTKLAVGDPSPPYVGHELGGSDITLNPASGKAYVISFWASWCGPCLKELPILANIQAIAGTDKMQVIAVNIEDREAYRPLQRTIRDSGLTSTYDPDRRARQTYGVGPIPHMVIVGRDGRISAIRIGYSSSTHEELATALNHALEADLHDLEPAKASAPAKP